MAKYLSNKVRKFDVGIEDVTESDVVLKIIGDTHLTGKLGLGGANYGASGEVLTSNGPGSAPTWQDSGGGGGGGAATDKIEENNTKAEVIDTGTDGRFIVNTDGVERLRIDSDKFEVSNGTTPLFLVNDNVSDGNIFELNRSDGDLAFGVDSTTGNVSIGGVDSTSKLHVDGDVTITGDISADNFNTSAIRFEAIGIGIDADSDIPLQIYNETTSTALFSVNDNVSDGIIFGINNINSSSLFSVDADGTILFRTSGNVGIGTTLVEPTSKLHVDGDVTVTGNINANGDVTVAGNISAANFSNTNADYETGKFGAIGIGIDADPDIPLQISNGTTSLFFVNDNVSDGNIFELNRSDGDLAFGVDSTTGNVSIGGVEPTSKLHVDGDVTITGDINAANFNTSASRFEAMGIGIDADPDIPLQIYDGTTSLFLVNDNVSDGNIFELNKSDGDLAFGVDSTSGNVSIGGVDSTSKLHVDGDVTITGDINAANFNTDGIRLEALGIGVDADPDIPLQIYNETTSTALFSINDNVSDGIIFGINDVNSNSLFSADADGTILFRTSGNVGIGTTLVEPTSKLHVDGEVSATNFNTISDARLKTNIQVIGDPLKKVLQINGVSFNWVENNKPSLGVIADNIQEILPELVTSTNPKSVNYNGLIGLLIEVVKQQQDQINSLNDRISKLE